MRHSLTGCAVAALWSATPAAMASVTTNIDSFGTVMSAPLATDWGVSAVGTPQTGADVLGTRQVTSIAYWQSTLIHEISFVGSGDGSLAIRTRGDGAGSNAWVQVRGTIAYRNFGLLDLSADGQALRLAGQGVYGVHGWGGITTLGITLHSAGGSSTATVDLTSNGVLNDLTFELNQFSGSADMTSVSGIDFTVRSSCGVNGGVSFDYEATEFSVVPAPAAAPLLALAGLTARGRRRR